MLSHGVLEAPYLIEVRVHHLVVRAAAQGRVLDGRRHAERLVGGADRASHKLDLARVRGHVLGRAALGQLRGGAVDAVNRRLRNAATAGAAEQSAT